jgi:uncharacterized protein (DUF4415 family)
MAEEDIRLYSLDEIREMIARGEDHTDWERLKHEPGLELEEDFWRNARVVVPPRKTSIHLRVDSDVLDWFKAQGKGYLTRMNAVLRSYMEARRDRPK